MRNRRHVAMTSTSRRTSDVDLTFSDKHEIGTDFPRARTPEREVSLILIDKLAILAGENAERGERRKDWRQGSRPQDKGIIAFIEPRSNKRADIRRYCGP
ncbi:unnamed protein product [Nesidiocoris tenuis]|uniref:Uncharacterized protein n=1 Tax=Nesidiocoris tenuis TaxID=355587 RepID=A0A6H5FTQ6_9HEMI|nr:unnamed protein product [Nesidiocoris tenuis]